MKSPYFLPLLFLAALLSQRVDAQSIATSDKAVFYNLSVSKCAEPECAVPYTVTLENVNIITGEFKGLNKRLKPVYESNDFLVTVYNKRTGAKEWETVVANPVAVNIEYDAHSHDADAGSTLQRKIIEQPTGSIAVRLPFEPSECNISVAYIASPDNLIELASF